MNTENCINEIRCSWLILFITNLVMGLCGMFIEMILILSDKAIAEIFSKVWPVSVIIGIFSFFLAWGLYHHAYQGYGTKLAQAVQIMSYIVFSVLVLSVFITIAGSSQMKETIENKQRMEFLRWLPFLVPFIYFLLYNYRLIRINRRVVTRC